MKTYHILGIAFLFLSTFSWAQPKQLSEQEIKAQEIFIEANKEKILGNYDEALKLYKEVLNKNKKNHAAMFEIAQMEMGVKNEENAFSQIEAALKLAPDQVWYNKFYVSLLEKRSRYDEAAKVYERLSELYPNEEEYYFEQAYFYATSNQHQKAIDAFDKLENLAGVNEEISIRKHRLFLSLNQPENAAKELAKLSEANPRNTKYRIMLAELYEQLDQKDQASKVYKEVLAIDPDNIQAKKAAGGNFKKSGNHSEYLQSLTSSFQNPEVNIDMKVKEMIEYIEIVHQTNDETLKKQATQLTQIVTEVHPKEAKAYSLHGDMLYNTGNPKEALAQYKKAIGLKKNIYTLWQQSFMIMAELRAHDELIDFSEQAMDYFPNQPSVYFFNGLANGQKNNHKEALNMFDEAFLMAGKNNMLKGDILVQKAQQYHGLKQYTNADKSLNDALEINPNNLQAQNTYAYLLAQRNEQLDKAEEMAKSINNKVPNQPVYQHTMALVLYKKKAYKDAKKWMEKSIASGGNNSPEILEHFGDVLYKLNEVDQAVSKWQEALDKGGDLNTLQKKITSRKLVE